MTAKRPERDWLSAEESRVWLAFTRVRLRLGYEMNRQLQTDSGLSLADYDVLTALGAAPTGRMAITALAAQIGWERSRLSHHVRRMVERGQVATEPSADDRRVTEVFLAERGRAELAAAAPGHVDLVRRLFFDGLPDLMLGPLAELLEGVHRNLVDRGSLPDPEV